MIQIHKRLVLVLSIFIIFIGFIFSEDSTNLQISAIIPQTQPSFYICFPYTSTTAISSIPFELGQSTGSLGIRILNKTNDWFNVDIKVLMGRIHFITPEGEVPLDALYDGSGNGQVRFNNLKGYSLSGDFVSNAGGRDPIYSYPVEGANNGGVSETGNGGIIHTCVPYPSDDNELICRFNIYTKNIPLNIAAGNYIAHVWFEFTEI